MILAFVLCVQPMQSCLLNFMEFINEATFLSFTYLCLLFTDYMETNEFQFTLGYVGICILGINFMINLIVLCYFIYNSLNEFINVRSVKKNQNKTLAIKPDNIGLDDNSI